LNGFNDFRTENGSSQDQNLALTVLFVPNSLDSGRCIQAYRKVDIRLPGKGKSKLSHGFHCRDLVQGLEIRVEYFGFRVKGAGHPSTRWSTTLSPKVNLPHAIYLRASCDENLVT